MNQSSLIAATWNAEPASLGPGMPLLRALPVSECESIGPFIFLDHLGPMPPPGHGVGAHPHAGIEVITYLIEGANEHRDSLGNYGRVSSGGAQWMNSGRGILHAESIGDPALPTFHAVQLWTKLPKALEETEPSYRAVSAAEIPEKKIGSTTLRLISGTLPSHFEKAGPVKLAQPSLLMYLQLAAGDSITIPLQNEFENGVYGLSGETTVEDLSLTKGNAALFSSVEAITLENKKSKPSELLLLGGEATEKPLFFYGPFVFFSKERLRQAERDLAAGKMGQLK